MVAQDKIQLLGLFATKRLVLQKLMLPLRDDQTWIEIWVKPNLITFWRIQPGFFLIDSWLSNN